MTIMRRINLDWPLVFTALLLSVYGVLMVYSAGQTDTPTGVAHAYLRQIDWLVVGLLGAYAMSRASVRLVEWMAIPAYAVAVLLLVVVLIPGFGSGRGSAASVKGWLTIGRHQLGEPAEFAKLAVVLMLARVLAQQKTTAKSILDLWKPMVVVSVPMLLIFAQPDLGTSIVFAGVFFSMLFWAGVPWRLLLLIASPIISLVLGFNTGIWGAWFLAFVGLLVWYKPYIGEGVLLAVANLTMGLGGPTLWDHMKPYQRDRLRVFLDPSYDPRGSGFHVTQSQVAIGSGGWLGRGFTHGPQKRGGFLPEQHTDFIFAVVGEELGFIGVTLAIALFLFLFLRVIRISERANDSFGSLVAFGLMATWLTHVVENMGMTLNLLPITGIPLPFFSYGGSFMLASWLAVGILARISSEGRGGVSGTVRL